MLQKPTVLHIVGLNNPRELIKCPNKTRKITKALNVLGVFVNRSCGRLVVFLCVTLTLVTLLGVG